MGSATAGMAAAMTRLNDVASQAASGDVDMASQAVGLARAKTQLRASAAVLRATNEMMGTLLDVVG